MASKKPNILLILLSLLIPLYAANDDIQFLYNKPNDPPSASNILNKPPHFIYTPSTRITSEPTAYRYTPVPPKPPPKPCEYPPRDISLTFSNLGLNRIGDNFVRSNDVSALYLDGNQIEDISSGAFHHLSRLQFLNLSNNKIPVKKLLWLGHCHNLRTLLLDDNKANSNSTRIHAEMFESLELLEKLYLRGNTITNIDISFNKFSPRLTHLYLSRNNISSTKFLDNLPRTLTHLYLEDNFVSNVKEDTTRNLVELFLDGNKIKQLCSDNCEGSYLSLKGSSRLERLQLSRNNIREIGVNTFRHTDLLWYLDLSRNKIDSLENGTLHGLRSLKSLQLSYNHLITIPNLCTLNYLQTLDLSNNKIAGVHKDSFCNLSKLKRISLNNNQITSVETYGFYALTELEYLNLSDNLLVSLPATWIHRSNYLRFLELKNNRVVSIDKLAIAELGSLEELHLEGNPLISFSVKFVRNYPLSLMIYVKEPSKRMSLDDDEGEDYNEKDEKDDKDEADDESDESVEKGGLSLW